MYPRYIILMAHLVFTAPYAVNAKPNTKSKSQAPILFEEIRNSQFRDNSQLIEEIIKDDPSRLYDRYQHTTPLEHAIYSKSWQAAEILMALDDTKHLMTYHGHLGNPIIHMLIEQGAPFWLLKSALQIQPYFCIMINITGETALERLINIADKPDHAVLLAIAGSDITDKTFELANTYKRVNTSEILMSYCFLVSNELDQRHIEQTSPEQTWSSTDSSHQTHWLETQESFKTDI